MRLFPIVFWMTMLLVSFQKYGQASENLEFDNTLSYLNLIEHAEYFQESGQKLTFEKIFNLPDNQFQPLPMPDANLGYTNLGYWLRIPLIYRSEDSSSKITTLLEIAHASLAVAEIFYTNNEGNFYSLDNGYLNNMEMREVGSRYPTFRLEFEANERKTIYLRLERSNGVVRAPLRLWEPVAYANSISRQNLFYGAIFSVYLMIALYNLVIYAWTKEKLYAFYVGYVITFSLASVSNTGFGFMVLWPNLPWVNNWITQFSAGITMFLLVRFTQCFLETQIHAKNMHRTLSIFGWLFIAIAILAPTNIYHLGRPLSSLMGPFFLVVIVTGIFCLRKKVHRAKFFVSAFSFALAGGFLNFLASRGVLPSSEFFFYQAIIVGTLIETVILAIALADQLNHEKEQKFHAIKAQRDALMTLEATKKELLHQGTHHLLTKLPNAVILFNEMKELFDKKIPFSLIMMRLENFHEVNNTLGHDNGDQIIKEYAYLLNGYAAKNQNTHVLEVLEGEHFHLAHINISSFAAIIPEFLLHKESDLKKILYRIPSQIRYQSMKIDLNPAFGISKYPQDGKNTKDLWRFVQIALENSLHSLDKIIFYDSTMDVYSAQKLALMSELKTAISENQLTLNYQPQLDLRENCVKGVECLVRWIHPEHGFIPPNEFILNAEKTGVIHELTRWVFKTAMAALLDLDKQGIELAVSINISAINLRDSSFYDWLEETTINHREIRERLILEVTETAVMENVEEAISELERLTKIGFKVSVDDFGTGYSSLAYLRKLPANELKVDRSFVMHMLQNPLDKKLVKTILDLSQAFSMEVVAEGIEDQETLSALKDMGCDVAQGYHISRPVSFEQLPEALDTIKQNLIKQKIQETV